jgi:hypothetical protein
MADDQNPLESDQWIAKTDSPIGVDLTQAPPEMRYQLLGGRIFTLQVFPSGAIARGEIAPSQLDFPAHEEGWYDGLGKYLGDEPNLPTWE